MPATALHTNTALSPPLVTPVALWLASWYPSALDAFSGDFVQRSARALSAQMPVHVLHIARDTHGAITTSQKTETRVTGQLTETIIYYYVRPSGMAWFDKLVSTQRYLRISKQWLKQFKASCNGRPILVEVCVAMRAGLLALWMHRRWQQPFLVQEHWVGYYTHLMPPVLRRNALFWYLSKRILAKATALLPDSRHLGAHINATLLPMAYTEMPNAVDTSLFYWEPKPAPSTFQFIHVSTLGHQKNTDGIIRCFQQLCSQRPSLKMELLVVGPDFEPLQQQFSTVPNLRFTGALPYAAVAALVRKANAMVLFSRYENLPCVMLEAFCAGLPVIATNVGGISYHLPPQNGLLIPSQDEPALVAALESIVTQYARYNTPQIAQQAASTYGYANIARLYLQAYRQYFPQWFA
ncbi:MAG: glycosyltransferase [Bacteroidetes bacterium]|nr:MAG: glycosyltransferase [Bacteroidota bacterium]